MLAALNDYAGRKGRAMLGNGSAPWMAPHGSRLAGVALAVPILLVLLTADMMRDPRAEAICDAGLELV